MSSVIAIGKPCPAADCKAESGKENGKSGEPALLFLNAADQLVGSGI
ncbi:MAG: hypothetical protein J0H40_10535 [Rhizobiales bacterium]|nr:hypothetical protein [Hyphomicrobiales bacterium]